MVALTGGHEKPTAPLGDGVGAVPKRETFVKIKVQRLKTAKLFEAFVQIRGPVSKSVIHSSKSGAGCPKA